MSIEELLAQKEQESGKYLALDKVPNRVKVKVVDAKFKNDSGGNECLFLYLENEEAQIIVQKYTVTGFKELRTALEANGGLEKLKTKMHTWEKKMLGRSKYPRLLPIVKD